MIKQDNYSTKLSQSHCWSHTSYHHWHKKNHGWSNYSHGNKLGDLIIHMETKYARYSNSREILNKILNLKTFALKTLLNRKTYFYTRILHSDSGKVMLIVKNDYESHYNETIAMKPPQNHCDKTWQRSHCKVTSFFLTFNCSLFVSSKNWNNLNSLWQFRFSLHAR